MNKNTFLKISAAIFILLAVIISLFPPFEFGNEKLRTLSERKSNSDIVNKLPIKQYDFIFGSNKKSFALGYYIFTKKFYGKNFLEDYKKLNSDYGFYFLSSSADTFITAKRYLYKDTTSKENTKNKGDKKKLALDDALANDSNFVSPGYDYIYNQHPKTSDTPGPILSPKANNNNDKTKYKFDFSKSSNYVDTIFGNYKANENDSQTNNRIKYDDGSNTDAINYKEVKEDYNKAPGNWDFKYIDRIDSIKKYDEYKIAQPIYYLLDRKILLGELLVEYILAFFISLVIGYLTERIPFLRKLCVGIME